METILTENGRRELKDTLSATMEANMALQQHIAALVPTVRELDGKKSTARLSGRLVSDGATVRLTPSREYLHIETQRTYGGSTAKVSRLIKIADSLGQVNAEVYSDNAAKAIRELQEADDRLDDSIVDFGRLISVAEETQRQLRHYEDTVPKEFRQLYERAVRHGK